MITTLAVPFADTAAADLAWTLAAPRRPWLDGIELRSAGGEVLELGILGSSHQVVLRHAENEIVETVACGVTPSASHQRLPDVTELSTTLGSYRFNSDSDDFIGDAEGFGARVVALLAELDGRANAIVARFPRSPDALTAIDARWTTGGVTWRTWHTYPQTRTIVRTSSEVVW